MILGEFRSLEEKAKFYLDKIKKEDRKYNSFLYVDEGAVKRAAEIDKKKRKGRLYGYVIGVKANINVKGMPISCASKTLENYYGSFDAKVVEEIKKEDGLIIGILNMDEFACGSSGESSAFGPTENPAVPGYITGGSSSGSAASVAAGFCDVSLGSDTGGSIRNPASFCGVIGVKPSYGMVSRYGLIDLSMSLDQIGPIGRRVEDVFLVLDVIKGVDERDTTTVDFGDFGNLREMKKVKTGVVRVKGIDKRIQKAVDDKIEEMKGRGWSVEEVIIDHIDLAIQTYYPMVYAEFFSATRRFDGRKYGKKIDENSGEEVLRRILGGSEITKAEFEGRYYEKALQVKDLIKGEFEAALSKFDCLVMPTVPGMPWKIGEGKKMKPEEVYSYDSLTIPANLAEVCAVSLPVGQVEGFPIGMQIICKEGEDSKMLSIAKSIDEL